MPSKIRKLSIFRFRGIKELTWHPATGVNLVLGGGDTGKTTVLEAIDLLFSSATSLAVSETDYWMRELTEGFRIEGVVKLGNEIDISNQSQMAYPWHWDGKDAVLPDPTNDDGVNDEVYKFRFSANPQQEVLWEIVQPDDTTIRLSVHLRRQVRLISLPSDDRNDKDLRLVYGSALDRHIGDPALRSRIGSEVAALNLHEQLLDEGKKALEELDEQFGKQALPSGISLGLASSQGVSIGALVGLLAKRSPDTLLPISAWGAGTRRLASLEIGAANHTSPSVISVDEAERGLEPYRLRQFMTAISQQDSQAFVTTHSPIAISCTPSARLWYMDANGKIGALKSELVQKQQKNDPETFLARMAVIAEGVTEVGFLGLLLQRALGRDPLDCGIRVCNGQGNDNTCLLLKALDKSGLQFAGLADNEGKRVGTWQDLKDSMGNRLVQWDEGCTEEAVISAIPDAQIPLLIGETGDDFFGTRLNHLMVRAGSDERTLTSVQVALAGTDKTLKQFVIEAASGDTDGATDDEKKAWKSHSSSWFKTERGGRELAKKAIALGAWGNLEPKLRPLLEAILATQELPITDNLPNV